MPKAISFFAGAGGLDIGIHKAGFNITLSVEIEKIFCDTLITNNPSLNAKQGDIMNYTAQMVRDEAGLIEGEEIDLIFGGSPCQSFSTAGKRLAFTDPRGKAMLKFADLVSELRPKVFLIENVKGLLSAPLRHIPHNQRGKDSLLEEEKPGSALKYLLSKFPGYRITPPQTLNAADYGVPQKRERVFIVGVREDLNKKFIFPETTHNENGSDGKQKWRTVREVFNTISNTKHTYVTYSSSRLAYMKLIPQGGGNWRDLPPEIVEKAMGGAYKSGGGKVGYFRRINIDKPSPTLLTSPSQNSTNLGHPFEDRPLSIEEYLAIQEFPTNYQVKGTINQQYTQIGNAVPIRLAYVIGNKIMKLLKNTAEE